MDDIVKAALKKWPNVPHCYGWLGLDARGDWYLRDAATQAAGPFPQAKGSRVTHEKLREFICRNYEHDDRGAWFFQNGPQRVYLELEAAPFVWRLQPDGRVLAHTGQDAGTVLRCLLDEQGRLFLATPQGLGVVRSLDMDAAADAIEAGLWAPEELSLAGLTTRYGYLLDPQPAGA